MYCKETDVMIRKGILGIGSMPMALIVKKAHEFESLIWVEKDGNKVNARDLLDVLKLNIRHGTHITFISDGTDEIEAVNALVELVTTNYIPD